MLPWKGRGFDLDLLPILLLNLLDHDDGIGAFGQDMTGIDMERVLAKMKDFGP